MDDKPEKSNKRTNRFLNGLMIIGLSILLLLILVGVFGRAGEYVKNFFIGVFGYAIYGYTIAFTVMGLLMMFGWSSSQSKLGVKITFAALVALVIAMCHIGASRELAGLGYGEYLKQCYLTHSTAGGILGGIFFYPLTKAFIFSMVFLGLVVAGLVALLIVMHINYELIIPTKSNKVKVYNKKVKKDKIENVQNTEFYNQDNNGYDYYSDEEQEDPARVLYNGTVTGKDLPDDFSKSRNSNPSEYVPLEEIGSFEKKEEPKKGKGPKQSKQKSRENLSEIQQEAIKVLYDSGDLDVQYHPPTIKSVDVSNTVNQTRKHSEPKKVEPQEQPLEEQPKEDNQKLIDDKYKSYTNNFRKNQVLENMGVTDNKSNDVNDDNNIEDNQSDEDFLKGIEESLNIALNSNSAKDEDQKEEIIEDDLKQDQKQEDIDSKDNQSVYQPKIDLGDLDKPRDDNKYKIDEDKVRENRLNELREKGHGNAPNLGETQPAPKVEIKPVAPTPIKPVPIVENKVVEEVKNEVKEEAPKKPRVIKPYVAPSIDLLEDYSSKTGSYNEEAMQAKCKIFEDKMKENGVDVEVFNVVKGPTFSRIEFRTNSTLSKVISHTNDISMWLAVKSMRLEAPIPGRDCCGIEIPNDEDSRGMVGLRSIVESKKFQNINTEEGVYFALGKDIDGKDYVANICDFPHALIAGGTGSGKSVCINCMLVSMLYKYSPEELRFILVDPKVVELNKYKNIPHLLVPEIINEPKKVIKALKWLAVEMDRRYEVLEPVCASNLEQYNQCVEDKDKLPTIVCVIDEVGDIMCSPVKKEFETLVQKLTQKARAAGIYLILATQRPSVDVITGTIKNNLPTRIAFAVPQSVDSKTILDTVGAEKLLGKGDMLFKQNGKPDVVRVQGAFVHPKEIKRVVDAVRENNEVYYDESAYEAINKVDEEPQDENKKVAEKCAFMDELCPNILRYVAREKDFSTSKLQRIFNIGFNRASNIYEWMESQGYCEDQNNKKHCLITEEQAEEIIKETENNNNQE